MGRKIELEIKLDGVEINLEIKLKNKEVCIKGPDSNIDTTDLANKTIEIINKREKHQGRNQQL